MSAALGLVFVACGGDVAREPDAAATAETDFGGAPSAGASVWPAGAGGQLTSAPPVTVAGESGGAGSACQGGLQVLLAIEPAPLNVVALPEQRLAWQTQSTIQIYDAGDVLVGGSLALVAELTQETFGLTSDWSIIDLREYDKGLIVVAHDEQETKLFSWHLGAAPVELALPPLRYFTGVDLADPEAGLAWRADGLVYRAIEKEGTWVVGAPIGTYPQNRTPLAFDGDDLLVGLREPGPSYDGGEAESGGEAGTAGRGTARVERWNSAGELLASYPAVGNPQVAARARGGWLIGETNSFWGSYEAALQWLTPGNDELRTLTYVPVRSSGDGEDGAFGVAVDGSTVFVANCESGLLYGKWQGNAVALNPLGKAPTLAGCNPTSVHAMGELLVLGGKQLTFARLCDE